MCPRVARQESITSVINNAITKFIVQYPISTLQRCQTTLCKAYSLRSDLDDETGSRLPNAVSLHVSAMKHWHWTRKQLIPSPSCHFTTRHCSFIKHRWKKPFLLCKKCAYIQPAGNPGSATCSSALHLRKNCFLCCDETSEGQCTSVDLSQ